MSEINEAIQEKCLAFSDRIIKLNDYLLEQAANKKPGYKMVNGKRIYNKSIPVHLQAGSNLCNQLLRSGTSIGANNAEATNAVSKTRFSSTVWRRMELISVLNDQSTFRDIMPIEYIRCSLVYRMKKNEG